ncbi:MAG TPA: helix-turn-helix transcriptional regulator [Pseudonocardiaceae bacterium]|nr:helix-turn-helix transcriptional regulator [Pseudonocardiaceae bacterium]
MSEGVTSPWHEWPEVRVALDARDVGAVYRLLQRVGLSQREIARRTGQAQSEVSEILRGRQVRDVTVLERICDGLGVPREFMRLAGGAGGGAGAYSGGGTNIPEEVDAEMLRRVLLAAGVALVGPPVPRLGELLALPGPAPVPLPSRVDGIHVARVRNLTRRLGEAGNADTDPEVLSAAAGWATRLLGVSGVEPLRRALMVAVAELHIEAGWAGFDAWRYDRAMYHFGSALELANQAGDAYLQATALSYAGVAILEHGHPNDALKMIQVGQVRARHIPRDEPRAVVVGEIGRTAREACLQENAANTLADLGDLDGAAVKMARARELWSPTRADRYGDLDRPAALLALRRGRLDVAEPLEAASVRRCEGISPVGHALSSIVLATVHVRAGERGGLPLAHNAITAVSRLSSVRARGKLEPLAAALETQPGRDAQDLARMARRTTATRM